MRILIGGDFAPTICNFNLFQNGEEEKLYGTRLLEYASEFDYRIFDFECCFGQKGDEEVKEIRAHYNCAIRYNKRHNLYQSFIDGTCQ